MNLLPIAETSQAVVVDSGVPGKERVVFRPTDALNLAQYVLTVGIRQPTGDVRIANDLFFMFDDFTLLPPAWVIVFTGTGDAGQKEEHGKPVIYRYWGRPQTIFTAAEIVPVMFKLDRLLIGGHARPQRSLQELLESGKTQ